MKKKRNWLEKFQDFWWDDLTPIQRKCLWPVLTALRGYDDWNSSAYRVKLGTTARIRRLLLGKKIEVKAHTQCLPIYGYVSREKIHTITYEMRYKCGDHFNQHVRRAVEKLKSVVKKSEMKDLLEIFEPKDKTDESNQSAKSS